MQTTGGPLVYHLAHQVGDDSTSLDESVLFSQTLNSILDGFVPFEHSLRQAARTGFAPLHEGRLEERALLLLGLSINPMSLAVRSVPNLHAFKQFFAVFNADANAKSGVRNWIEGQGDRIDVGWEIDMPLTPQQRSLTHEALDCLVDVTRRHILCDLPPSKVTTEEPPGFDTMLSLGRALNRAHTLAFALIEVLREQPQIQSDAAAKALGCSSRTLQRHLQAGGLSLPRLRLAGNLLRSVGMLRRGGSLSDVAAEAGFCDYSHFARTLGRSCGFRPPNFQRALASLDISRQQMMA